MVEQFIMQTYNHSDVWDAIDTSSRIMYDLRSTDYNYTLKLNLGSAAVFGTAAYWIYQWYENCAINPPNRSGRSLENEILYCMLGGFGITGELSNAYFDLLTEKNINLTNKEEVERALKTPVQVNGRDTKYRFPVRKAEQISAAIRKSKKIGFCTNNGRVLRNQLLGLPGIGPKTASWIARNYFACDDVAIIDIHVHRAGQLAGFFKTEWSPSKHYFEMEDAFIQFANAFGLLAGSLDILIWNQMRIRNLPRIGL